MTRTTAGEATDIQKLLYPVPRPSGVSATELAPRWQEHQQRILDVPAVGPYVTHYELCRALTPADEPALPEAFFAPGGISDAWGGVGEAWLEGGMEAITAISSAPEIVESRAHEAEVFGSPIEHSLLVQDETVFDNGGTAIKAFSFLSRQPSLSLAEFADQWGAFGDLFLEYEELTRHCSSYVQSHVVDPTGTGETRFDGVAIMGFRTIEDVVAFMATPALAEELFPAEGPFLDRTKGVVILTRPTALLDRG